MLSLRLESRETDARAATSLRLRIASLQSGPLDDPDAAAATLAAAAEHEDTLPVVAEPLADLYQRLGRDDALRTLAERAARTSSLGSERANWRLRIADSLERAGNLEGAAEAVRHGECEIFWIFESVGLVD